MVRSEFEEKIGEFEEILQKVAGEIANGTLSEKLPPSELLKKAENHIDCLRDLATASEEIMLILKPEGAPTVQSKCKNVVQTLTTFRDILLQNTTDPLANSRLAFEQLRKALTDGSDLLFLMREVRDTPSPLIKYVLGRIDEFSAALVGLEKKVDEMKQIARELQEESLKILASKAPAQSMKDEKQNRKEVAVTFKS